VLSIREGFLLPRADAIVTLYRRTAVTAKCPQGCQFNRVGEVAHTRTLYRPTV